MDSGSGSLQSSSAGDEDYDSHHLFPHAPPLFFNTTTPPPPPPPQHQLPFHLPHHNFQNPLLFDFPSTNFNPNPTSLRSTPNRSTNPLHPKPATTKKRTRASRRAPTTVLTTDTTNFRAMVQEFTGIPSPPFTAASSSSSRRFDLFGSVTTNLQASRPKVQIFSSFNNNNNVSMEDQNASNLQGIFPLQSVSEGIRLDSPHIPLALQNDELTSKNCKLKFTGSSSSRDKIGEYW